MKNALLALLLVACGDDGGTAITNATCAQAMTAHYDNGCRLARPDGQDVVDVDTAVTLCNQEASFGSDGCRAIHQVWRDCLAGADACGDCDAEHDEWALCE